ncbi:PilW family protein [Luteimonas sp. BDR2-5]|uniref:PilW family protein n=1 Tax=Proluteimonas luteida TaxID=2878685 RepID=UPI001E3211D5|nr:PilW family protein [Luteimonas sp. BDR2-5]MCD9029781.1 PilW family protein [Luteimonas sp. BDR2-5]
MNTHRHPRVRGFSLIELMIAMLIGLLLLIGVVQLFSASRAAYQLSEGMSRVQENGRFAIDFLQRDTRMAGHFGCVNDQSHSLADPAGITTTFASSPAAAVDPLRFDISIQGYEAEDTAPGEALTLPAIGAAAPASGWAGLSAGSPVAAATANRVPGSDILVLRYLAPEGVPVTSIGGAGERPSFAFDGSRWNVLRSGVDNPGLFGVADCLGATVFQASTTGPGNISTAGAAPLNAVDFTAVFTPGQAVLYRAESLVYFVGFNGRGGTSLYRVRYGVTPGAAGAYGAAEEMVEGIENMQLLYGFDREMDSSKPPTGYIDRQMVALSGADDTADNWRRLGLVQIGLLGVSDRATASQPEVGREHVSLGVTITQPDDGRLRAVYQTTVAVRNRLYGN